MKSAAARASQARYKLTEKGRATRRRYDQGTGRSRRIERQARHALQKLGAS